MTIINITGVGVLDKGVAILDVVERAPAGTSELAHELELPLSTAYRLANALVTHGLLRQDAHSRFHLGPRFTTSALVEAAQPILETLRDHTGESAQLWVRRGQHRLCVAAADSRAELRATLPVGTLLPLPNGSAAQALECSPEPPPHPHQDWTATLAARQPGVASVSTPVRNHQQVIAAICLSGPLHRLQPNPGDRYGPQVTAAARHLEHNAHLQE